MRHIDLINAFTKIKDILSHECLNEDDNKFFKKEYMIANSKIIGIFVGKKD